ncbi:MAG: CHAP domain-containing protein [Chloroflexota bacterium]|nr:CHAP domain-containing protein [Chloroflexota bacterium]
MSNVRSTILALCNRAPMDRRKAIVLATTLLLVCATMLSIIPASGVARAAASTSRVSLFQTSFKLDGVTLSLSSASIPGKFVVSPGDDMIQMASSVASHPYREMDLEAIPFNVAPPLEALPIAHSGEAGLYRSLLHQYRASHGGHLIANVPAIALFGTQVRGEANLLNLQLDGRQPQDAVVTEYVTEAGGRLWLMRIVRGLASQDLGHETASSASTGFLSSLATISVSSTTLNKSSTLIASLSQPQSHPEIAASGPNPQLAPSVPFPGWWNGVCNYYNFLRDTGWQSWQMNGGLDGVYPCGPRPAAGGPNHGVQFYSGSWGALEFQCVELSLRWMYLAWGVSPYPGNGNDMVRNFAVYHSSSIIKEVYNSPGCCLFPEPGDVVSYCSACSAGHTSVVLSSNVDGNGNGSVTVMEENGTHSGLETLGVSNYYLQASSPGPVYGWLHNFG